MALFSKPPAKKPAAPGSERADDAPRGTPVRDSNAGSRRHIAQRAVADEPGPATLTGASLIDWSHAYSAIEVAETNPGLCAVLENAALLYAAGQPDGARATLADGLANDPDTKMSPLAWLAMFDLLQRSNLRYSGSSIALSVDGRRIGYIRASTLGVRTVWVLEQPFGEPRQLAGTENVDALFFSPDGNAVAYFADGKLFRVPFAGGRPALLADSMSRDLATGVWRADGTLLVNDGIYDLRSIPEGGGPATVVGPIVDNPITGMFWNIDQWGINK